MNTRLARYWLTVIAALCFPATAIASPVGTIFSGPVSDDAFSVYWNPAAMTLTRGTKISLFGSATFTRISYTPDTVNPITGELNPRARTSIVAPNIAFSAVTDAGLEDFRFGLAFVVPSTQGARFDTSFDGKPSITRYYILDGFIISALLTPTVAYRINKYISVGLGLEINGVALKQEWNVDFASKVNQLACKQFDIQDCAIDELLSREDPTYDALANVSGFGVGVGVSAGVTVTPTPWMRLGLSVHSGSGSVNVPVDLTVDLPPALLNFVQSNVPSLQLPEFAAIGEVKVASPVSVAAGIWFRPLPRLELAGEFQWSQDSDSSVLLAVVSESTSTLLGDQVFVKGKTDKFYYSLRAKYRFLDVLTGVFRFEFLPSTRNERSITPVSIDFNRMWFHLGAAWRATSWGTVVLEFSQAVIFGKRVRNSLLGPNALPTTKVEEGVDRPTPTGSYSAASQIIGLSIHANF